MTNKSKWIGLFAAAAAVAMYAVTTTVAVAAHGGGHGGGGHRGGGGHHGGGEHWQPHAYHPSKHHEEHHAQRHDKNHGDHHEHFAHHNHHHESWHHGGWGPGFWGGAALGYGLGYTGWGGWGYNGGDTYVDNSTTVNPVSNESADDDSADDNSDENSPQTVNNQYAAASPNANSNFPVDDWPELGVVTYAGQYGSSQGQVVVRVVPNGAAAKAGFVPGDVILSINGQPTPSADSLDPVLDAAKGQFEAQVWDARTGRTSTLSGPLDQNAPAGKPASRDTAATEQ